MPRFEKKAYTKKRVLVKKLVFGLDACFSSIITFFSVWESAGCFFSIYTLLFLPYISCVICTSFQACMYIFVRRIISRQNFLPYLCFCFWRSFHILEVMRWKNVQKVNKNKKKHVEEKKRENTSMLYSLHFTGKAENAAEVKLCMKIFRLCLLLNICRWNCRHNWAYFCYSTKRENYTNGRQHEQHKQDWASCIKQKRSKESHPWQKR